MNNGSVSGLIHVLKGLLFPLKVAGIMSSNVAQANVLKRQESVIDILIVKMALTKSIVVSSVLFLFNIRKYR